MITDENSQTNQLPHEVASFTLANYEDLNNRAYSTTYKRILELQIDDYEWRRKYKGAVALALITLLLVQNFIAYQLLYIYLRPDAVDKLGRLLPIVIPATLVETAAMVQIMLKYLFAEINYQVSKA